MGVLFTQSSNNYVPYQHPEKLIPKFITNASKGVLLSIYGDGSNVREWTYVEDSCSAIETVLEKEPIGEV